MIEPIHGGAEGWQKLQMELIAKVKGLTAEVGKIVADYFRKCEEEMRAENKVVFKELQEKALAELARLEETVKEIPRTLQLHADKLQLEIDAAKDRIKNYSPGLV